MAYEVEIISSTNPIPDDINVNTINTRSLSATNLTANSAFFRSITSLSAVTQINSSTSGDFTVSGNLYVSGNINVTTGSITANIGVFPYLTVTSITASQSISSNTLSAGNSKINNIISSSISSNSLTTNHQRLYNFFEIYPSTAPSAPTTGNRIYSSTTFDQDALFAIDSNGENRVFFRDLLIIGKNITGSTITKGQVVYINDATGGFNTISLAVASTSANTTPIGLAFTDITNNSFGRIITNGIISNINTSSFSDGDDLYVSATAGTLTNIIPDFPLHTTKIGIVRISGVGNGSIYVNIRETHRDEDGESTNTFKLGDTLSGIKSIVLIGSNSGFINYDSVKNYFYLNTSLCADSITATNALSSNTISAGNVKFTTLSAINGTFNNLSANSLVYNSITSVEIVTTGSLNVQGSLDVTGSNVNTFIARFNDSNSAVKTLISNDGNLLVVSALTASKVGIGVTNPITQLHVEGSISSNSITAIGNIIINDAIAAGYEKELAIYSPNNVAVTLNNSARNYNISQDAAGLNFYNRTAGRTDINVNGSGHTTLNGNLTANGNLVVTGSNLMNYIANRLIIERATTAFAEASVGNTTNVLQYGVEGVAGNRMNGTIAGYAYFGSYNNYGITFHANNQLAATIYNNKNVLFEGNISGNGTGTLAGTLFLPGGDIQFDSGDARNIKYVRRIVADATDFAINNNANTVNNLLITDAGNVTIAGNQYVIGNINELSQGVVGTGIHVNGDRLQVGSSVTGDNVELSLNYFGYNYTNTYFRNFQVYDGKGASVINVIGSTKAVTFAGTISNKTSLTIDGDAGNAVLYLDADQTRYIQFRSNTGDLQSYITSTSSNFDFVGSQAGQSLRFYSGNEALALTIDSSQNLIAIGTLSSNSITSIGSIYSSDAGGYNFLQSHRGKILSEAAGYLNIRAGSSALNIDNNAGSVNLITISGNGYVGIGSNAPGTILNLKTLSGIIFLQSSTIDVSRHGIAFGDDTWGGRVKNAIISEFTGSWGKQNMHFIVDTASDNNGYTLGTDTKLYIDGTNGNVGIGTTSPQQLLHIQGGNQNHLRLQNSNGAWNIGPNTSGHLQVSTTAADILYVMTGGNVGIGTTNPSYKLHVAQNINGALNLIDISGNDGSGDGGSGIILSDNDSGQWTIFTRKQSPNNALHFATGEGGVVANAKMTVLTGGNVGIGTTSPITKLHVEGGISSNGLTSIDNVKLTSNLLIAGHDGNKVYYNLAGKDNYTDAATGVLVIKTTIPFTAANMFTATILGYSYNEAVPFEFTVGVYAGEGNFFNPGYFGTLPSAITQLRFARDLSDSGVAIVIGSNTASVYKYQIFAVRLSQSFLNYIDAYADGWSITTKQSLSGYDTITDIPPQSVFKSGEALFNSTATASRFYALSATPISTNELTTKSYVDSISAATISGANSGTIGTIAKFNSSTSLSNSIITESGTLINIVGSLSAQSISSNNMIIAPLSGSQVNNTIPKVRTINNTLVNSNISDDGTTVTINGTLSMGTNAITSVGAITSSGLLGVTVASGYAATFMGGNVGIGTTTPGTKLEVVNSVADAAAITVRAGTLGGIVRQYFTDNSGVKLFEIDADFTNNRMLFQADDATVMAILRTSGNVGIGTTTPSSKLSINGGLHVGGDSDAGDNNLLVDGNLTVSGTGPHTFAGNIEPINDNSKSLGSSTKRWSDVFAAQSTIGGLFEFGLKTNNIGENLTGTIVSWHNGKLIPCYKEEDSTVMGVIKHGKDEPIILGAEHILITGKIKEGDFIVTSKKLGHGKAVKTKWFGIINKSLTGKIIGQALEDANGESNLIKAYIYKH